jgi:hypothetical protein
MGERIWGKPRDFNKEASNTLPTADRNAMFESANVNPKTAGADRPAEIKWGMNVIRNTRNRATHYEDYDYDDIDSTKRNQ